MLGQEAEQGKLDMEFSEEQEELRASLQRFLADRAPIAWVRALYDDPRGTTDDVWRGLADLSVLGVVAPEKYGGAGLGMVDACVVLEELGRAVHPSPYASSAIGAVSAIALGAASDQQNRWLPGLVNGDAIGTVALLDEGRRAEWRDPLATASSTGEGWSVSGTKVHVPDACAANVLVVSATAADGVGCFVVEADAAGVTVEEARTVDGSRKFGRVVLDGAPAVRLATDDALDVLDAVADRLAVAAVADGVGCAAHALEICVEYAKDRQQFGRPIGSFQAVQHLLADMLRAVELTRAASYYGAWACDAADVAERHRAATMALAYATEQLPKIGADAVQAHGGIGFTWEHDIHLYFKRLLTLGQAGGGPATQLEELASIVLG